MKGGVNLSRQPARECLVRGLLEATNWASYKQSSQSHIHMQLILHAWRLTRANTSNDMEPMRNSEDAVTQELADLATCLQLEEECLQALAIVNVSNTYLRNQSTCEKQASMVPLAPDFQHGQSSKHATVCSAPLYLLLIPRDQPLYNQCYYYN